MDKLRPIALALALMVACDQPFPIIPEPAAEGVRLGFVCRLGALVVLRGWLIVPDWAGDLYLDDDGAQIFASHPATCDAPEFPGVKCAITPMVDPGLAS